MVARSLALVLALASVGCWNWDRFQAPRGPACDDTICACATDTCAGGNCTPRTETTSIALGYQFGCFVQSDGTVWCYGDDAYGQLGDGAIGDGEASPMRSVSTGFHVAAGGGDAFVTLLATGTNDASFWGLRPGDSMDSGTPATSAVSLGGSFDRLANGSEHACGIDGGVLRCFGSNTEGQLGVGDNDSRGSWAVVPGTWTDVSAGLAHTCGIQSVGSESQLFCWGLNDHGQLGTGDFDPTNAPVRVGTDGDWSEVSAGKDFTCARRGGQVFCWGASGDHQTADPADTADHPDVGNPVRAGGNVISDATALAAGRFHACMIRGADASIWCWGNDECGALASGELGTSRAEPMRVDVAGETTRWRSVAVGNHTTCAVREDGTAWCWGRRGDRLVAEDTLCGSGAFSEPATQPERVCF